ncbi:MAG: alkaline phosphatase family protein [Blastocatellia bacterium]|nr:alkaline phosphatase family protein [Blastocatellia bacterium]
MTKKPKVLIIGVDGATFDLIDPWVAEGRLPNISRMLERGAHGPLESTVIPNSFPGWTSCTTGVNPAKHGIFNALIRKNLTEYRMSVVNARDIRYERIWQILSRDGMRVGAMNVPCSYPPVEVNGFLIGGMLSPSIDSDFTHPKGLIKDVIAHTGDYIIDLRSKHIPREQMRDELLRSTELRGAAMKYLLETHDLDFAMMVFTETDRAQHYFWADMDPQHPAWNAERGARFGDVIRRVYEAVDVEIGRLVETVGPDTQVYIVSDHGFGPQNTYVYINRYLIEMGHLTSFIVEDVSQKVRYATRDLLESVGLLDTARAVRDTLFGAPETALDSDMKSGQMATKRSNIDRIIENIDWSKTVAYALVPRGVRINLKGREPQGIVEPENYENVRDRVMADLKTLTYPSGERVFDRVYRREEVMEGPYLEFAPDIVTCMPIGVPSCHLEPKEIFAVCNGATGSHTDYGVIIAAGPGIAEGVEVNGARLMDVAPTALYALGVPLNEDMDGRPVADLFTLEFAAEHSVTFRPNEAAASTDRVDPFSAAEEDDIMDQLKGLGYIN